MAQWRRLERIGEKLVRCSQVGHSTKGDIVSDPNFLAIHPYRRKVPKEYEGGTELTIGDGCGFSLEPPESSEEQISVRTSIWPYTELWAQWIAAGGSDDWLIGHGTKKTTYEVVRVGQWFKEKPEGTEFPSVRIDHDNNGRTIIDSRDISIANLNGYGLSDTTIGRGTYKTFDEGEQPGVPIEVERDGIVIGAYLPPISEGNGEEMMDLGLMKYVYRYLPYYIGFGGSASAIIKETVTQSEIVFPSGKNTPEQKSERYLLVGVGFEIRLWQKPGESPRIEVIGDGNPGASISHVEGGSEYEWEDLPDPDVPNGIDYKQGMMG